MSGRLELAEADRLASNVIAGPNSEVLRAITNERVGLTLWWRSLPPILEHAASALLRGELFEEVASGTPGEAVNALLASLPSEAACLGIDLTVLATLFADIASTSLVRIRLEHVATRTCPSLHMDAVRLRLLCTYAGRGTEWEDARGTVRRMPLGHVALLKGTRWLGCDALVRHRSPIVADAPRTDRHRLLLLIDQPELN